MDINEKIMEFYSFLTEEYEKEPEKGTGLSDLFHLAAKDQTAKIKLKFIELFLKEKSSED